MATKTTTFILCGLLLLLKLHCSSSLTWIRSGYWLSSSKFPISDINSTLFTHLICAYAELNSTYQLSVSSYEQQFSAFTDTVKLKNPSVVTLLSIGGGDANSTIFSSMVSQAPYRKSFIESSIKTARLYGFHGLDFVWTSLRTSSDMTNLGTLFDEWRAAVDSESRNSNESRLILTMMIVAFSPTSYPVGAIRRNLNWVHFLAFDSSNEPGVANFTGATAALYNPRSDKNIDFGIRAWIAGGLPASQLVLGLHYYGFAWKLVNPKDDTIGAAAEGAAISLNGFLTYAQIKQNFQQCRGASVYNASYVVNYCTIGSTCIMFEDVEAVRTKVSYAKEKRLLGYSVWLVSYDDNWVLSQAAFSPNKTMALTAFSPNKTMVTAQEDVKDHRNKQQLLVIILLPTAIVPFLLGFVMCYLWRRVLKSKGMMAAKKESLSKLGGNIEVAESFNSNSPNLQVHSFANIVAATNNFSIENKLGEGGYGPVYKGKLPNGQDIAVKRLSKTSDQGLQEFEMEVTLMGKLQHVNLLRVLGYCEERKERMLVYEYMPKKSLDFYIFDPLRQLLLNWSKRICIIEGVIQGLLYLQEYSNLTIIHRDLKASNILLDNEMNPKISDFGMAKIFRKDELEANTSRIVGTYGYVPPEYVRNGTYSTKYDVYSFGVLVLQIISGKKNSCHYGLNENLSLLEYAYDLWREGRGHEFIDPLLDDSSSSCKLVRCMQMALLCVQENPMDRPSMLEVFSMLRNETVVVATPKKPAFAIQGKEDEANASIWQAETISVNEASISDMVPR